MAWDEHALAAGSLRSFFGREHLFPNHAHPGLLRAPAAPGAHRRRSPASERESAARLQRRFSPRVWRRRPSACTSWPGASSAARPPPCSPAPRSPFPFMIDHLAHVRYPQRQPASRSRSYFLHRFLARERSSDLSCSTVTWQLQMLANGCTPSSYRGSSSRPSSSQDAPGRAPGRTFSSARCCYFRRRDRRPHGADLLPIRPVPAPRRDSPAVWRTVSARRLPLGAELQRRVGSPDGALLAR